MNLGECYVLKNSLRILTNGEMALGGNLKPFR
jgi:hypothetical protein